jgi:hypothetical protein
LASEKLAELGLVVSADTLRRWLLAEGLWQQQRQRDKHRQRRARRECFGELVQMDTSIHDWTEGGGATMVLVAMIDDATSRIEARFYPGETVVAHFDLLGRWLRKHGRPLALYTDRDSIFEAHSRGRPEAWRWSPKAPATPASRTSSASPLRRPIWRVTWPARWGWAAGPARRNSAKRAGSARRRSGRRGAQHLAGRRVLLVFFRGLACAHCRRQLEALARHPPTPFASNG